MKRSVYLPALFCLIMAGLLYGTTFAETPQKPAVAEQNAPVKKDADKNKKNKKEAEKKKDTDKKQPDAKKKPADKKPAAKKETAKKDAAKKSDDKKKTTEKKDIAAKTDGEKKVAAKEADIKKDEDKKESAPKKPTYELKKEPLLIKVTLKGIFEARKMTEVMIRPEEWSGFTVLKAVEHGARVKRGDLLVALDTEKIDRAIAEMKTEYRLSSLALKQAQNELKTIQTVAPLELAALERGKKISDEDYAYFLAYELPFYKEATAFRLKANKNYLDYQKEELRQLEKMYKADEITEETEEIVLRRARDSVEQGEFQFKAAKEDTDHTLKYDLPRREAMSKDSHKLGSLTYQARKALFPLALEQSRVQFEKLKAQHEKLDKKLKDIQADRALMTIKSPADGIVYHGRCTDGKWSGGSSDGKIDRDSSLPIKQTFMTIVQTRPLRIATQVPEKELHNVRSGQKGKAVPTGYPDVKLDVIVDEVAAIPTGSCFPATVTVALDKEAEPIMPGMTCELKLTAYEKKDALCVPPKSIKADPLDEDKFSVYVVDKDGKENKREVELGRRTDKKVEILRGLKAGDKILAAYPSDDGEDADKKAAEQKAAEKKAAEKKEAEKKDKANKCSPKKAADNKVTDKKSTDKKAENKKAAEK